MSSTRKLLVAITLPSGRTRGSDFLVPDPAGSARFTRLRTGRAVQHGLVVYTGTAVSAADLLERGAEHAVLPRGDQHLLRSLEAYIDALQAFAIGNVLRVAAREDGAATLEKVADRPPTLHRPRKLP